MIDGVATAAFRGATTARRFINLGKEEPKANNDSDRPTQT